MSNPILDSQRQVVAELEQKLLLEKAKLEGMEAIVKGAVFLRPDSGTLGLRTGPSRISMGRAGGGKAPGQLSVHWRSALEEFYKTDAAFDEADAAVVYRNISGKELLRLRDVRHKLKTYADLHQFLQIEPDGRFRVTDVAAERFGFVRTPKGGAVSDPGQGQAATPHLFGSQEGGEGYATPTT